MVSEITACRCDWCDRIFREESQALDHIRGLADSSRPFEYRTGDKAYEMKHDSGRSWTDAHHIGDNSYYQITVTGQYRRKEDHRNVYKVYHHVEPCIGPLTYELSEDQMVKELPEV